MVFDWSKRGSVSSGSSSTYKKMTSERIDYLCFTEALTSSLAASSSRSRLGTRMLLRVSSPSEVNWWRSPAAAVSWTISTSTCTWSDCLAERWSFCKLFRRSLVVEDGARFRFRELEDVEDRCPCTSKGRDEQRLHLLLELMLSSVDKVRALANFVGLSRTEICCWGRCDRRPVLTFFQTYKINLSSTLTVFEKGLICTYPRCHFITFSS